jgi:parvulin-like peptidyl-prolyl isomerase
MTKRFLPLQFALALVALLLAGCGGGPGVADLSRQDVAVVGGDHITRAQFEQILSQAKKNYEVRKQPFPKAGTQQYQELQNQIVSYLVQTAEYSQRAKEMGIDISKKEIDSRLDKLKRQFYSDKKGKFDPKKYHARLKALNMTEAQVRDTITTQLVSERIYKKVTSDVKVSDAEVRAYYDKHKSQFTTPPSRDVRHILVKSKSLADRLYGQLQAKNGANFTQLVKQYTKDPGSKQNGGRYTDTKGSFDPAFEKTAFSLKTKEISKPVHTQFGWHIIQALGPVKTKQVQPLSTVKDQIRSQLEQQDKNKAMRKWFDDTKKEFKERVKYAPGFAPPSTDTTSTTTTG